MIFCPKCGSVNLRPLHAVQRIEWGKRHRFWGAIVPRATRVAVGVDCNDCFYAFTSFPDGSFMPAAHQAVHDALAQVKAMSAQTQTKGPIEGKDAEVRPSRPQARPAPDPRPMRKR